MTAKEHIYFGFGHIVYSLAFSDGKIQNEEKKILQDILNSRLNIGEGKDISAIIFTLLNKEMLLSVESAFQMGIKNIQLGDNHLTKKMMADFNLILKDVAKAFPPSTETEKDIINQFNDKFNNL